jgi:uncharacterized protein (TIGR02466 family)
MSYTLSGLFPTPVQQGNIGRPFTQEELDFIKLHGEPDRIHKNMGNTTSNNRYILKEPEMKDVLEYINTSIKNYVANVIIPRHPVEFVVTQSWLNYTKDGEYHHKHAHPNSLISGVFYFDADFEKDKIYFFKDGYQQIKIPTDTFNLWTSDSWFFQVKTGDIMLFPSSLTHMVESKKGDNVRTSLAFNVFPKGYIGHEEELTALHL